MTKLYVGNLPRSMDEAAVRELFEKYGSVKSVALLREGGRRPRGHGFVEMSSAQAAKAVAALNNRTLSAGKRGTEEKLRDGDDEAAADAAEFVGFADEFRSAHQPIIDPEKFSKALHIQLQDLAKMAGVHRTTVTENPTNAKLQGYLREAVRAMSAAYEVTEDRDRTIFWFRNTPIAEYAHQTAEQLVAMGKTDAVIAYLQSIASGSSG
jgi:RNA recognition motif-containing protein